MSKVYVRTPKIRENQSRIMKEYWKKKKSSEIFEINKPTTSFINRSLAMKKVWEHRKLSSLCRENGLQNKLTGPVIGKLESTDYKNRSLSVKKSLKDYSLEDKLIAVARLIGLGRSIEIIDQMRIESNHILGL